MLAGMLWHHGDGAIKTASLRLPYLAPGASPLPTAGVGVGGMVGVGGGASHRSRLRTQRDVMPRA